MVAQSCNLCVEFKQAPLEHAGSFVPGVLRVGAQNRANILDRQACVAIRADLKQTLRVCLVVIPVVAATALWRWYQANRFVIKQSSAAQAAPLGEFANSKHRPPLL